MFAWFITLELIAWVPVPLYLSCVVQCIPTEWPPRRADTVRARRQDWPGEQASAVLVPKPALTDAGHSHTHLSVPFHAWSNIWL